jgi:hypothetical protein
LIVPTEIVGGDEKIRLKTLVTGVLQGLLLLMVTVYVPETFAVTESEVAPLTAGSGPAHEYVQYPSIAFKIAGPGPQEEIVERQNKQHRHDRNMDNQSL